MSPPRASPFGFARCLWRLGWMAYLLVWLSVSAAPDATPRNFKIPAGPAERTLKRFAAQAGREIVFPADAVAGVVTRALHGRYPAREALERLIAGTGLVVNEHPQTGAFVVTRRVPREGNRIGPSPPSTTNTKMPKKKPRTLLGALFAFALMSNPAVAADGTLTGSIEGRVLDARRAQYIEKALISVEGTSRQALTDADGQYRLTDVPAGDVKLRVFYTGLDPQMENVRVTSGQTTQYDITMPRSAAVTSETDKVITLDQYVVTTSKEMEGAAIAINEQRFAPNIVNVVAADEFGMIPDGSVGEFMKFLPGIVSDYTGGDARRFSINGVPSGNVPVTIGGFDLASTSGSGTGRQIELDQVSINSIARIEVVQSPTPESPGSALAGSVNMVPRSAFERSKPLFNYSAQVLMKDDEKHFRRTPGPRYTTTRKIHPGFDFSAIVPVNKRFGFTVSGGYSVQYTAQPSSAMKWYGAQLATGATANATLPLTTPDNPYLGQYVLRDGAKTTTRYSLGGTVDYKLSATDRISVSLQYSFLGEEYENRYANFLIGGTSVGNWGQTFTHGTPGKGEIRLNNTMRLRPGATIMPSFTYRHDGRIWRSVLGLGYSRSRTNYQDIDKGSFNAVQARRTGVTVSFDDINYLTPGRITVTDASGNPVDPYKLSSYALGTCGSTTRLAYDDRRTAYGNITRDFNVRGVPIAIKSGFDLRHQLRDLSGAGPTWTHVGADGKSSTTPVTGDDGAGGMIDEVFSQHRPPFGMQPIQWESGEKLWQYFQQHPEYFTSDETEAYKAAVQASKRIEELVSALYLRNDIAFFDRRLKVVGGVRAEQTNVWAEGPLNDKTRNYQRDASGNILYDSKGSPVLIIPSTDTLGVAKITRPMRGARSSNEYLTLFPSVNVSFDLRSNLILRGSYYESIGRPNLNYYASGITMPNPDLSPSTSNRFVTENPGIKPWTAKTFKVRLEYYFERVGQISVGAFRRDIRDFFAAQEVPVTPEFLALYGLDPVTYEGFTASTNVNMKEPVRTTGFEIDYKQSLTFLPHWARGIQIFANASSQHLEGTEEATSNFDGFIPRYGSWGISLSRPKYKVWANWNYRGAYRQGSISGNSIESGSFEYASKRLYVDVGAEYNIRRYLSLFVTMRNLCDAAEDTKYYGPNTPSWAKFALREKYGSLWTAGIKGTF